MTRLSLLAAPRKPAFTVRFTWISAALLALFAARTAMAAPPMAAPPEPVTASTGLEVHEWGTFTTLNSSAGKSLSGLYVDATRLPDFVLGLPYFNYDPLKGWAALDRLRNVTVKMETPVLYFYARKEMAVDVKVDFPGGTISQWYPVCYESETNPTGPFVDFAQAPYPGHAAWKATVLAPGPALPYSTTASGKETSEWTAPRFTESNQLRGANGEIEKFLFYRGLGNFPSAVEMRFLADGKLQVKNGGTEDIPYLQVYEMAYGGQTGSQVATVWYQGPMQAGLEIRLQRERTSAVPANPSGSMEDFRLELEKAGLTMMESRALLNTWYNGYFIEGGLKAFWILPRAMVDRILPLSIAPEPDKIERVIVGRSEILTPEFERELYQAEAADSLAARFGKDKYYMAYLDFLSKDKDWHMTTGTRPAPPAPFAGGSERAGSAASWLRPGADGWAGPWFRGPAGRGLFDAQGRSLPGSLPRGR
jgi:hypothetical protein